MFVAELKDVTTGRHVVRLEVRFSQSKSENGENPSPGSLGPVREENVLSLNVMLRCGSSMGSSGRCSGPRIPLPVASAVNT